VFIRVSDDLIRRDSQIYQCTPQEARGKNPDIGGSDIANTCLLLRIEASALIRRSLYMRGIPDDIALNGGQLSMTPAFLGAYQPWVNLLKSGPWAVRSIDPLSPSTAISNIVQAAGTGIVTITTTGPGTLTLPAIVTIRGVRGAIQVNGTWNVLSIIDSFNFTIKLNQYISTWTGQGLVFKNQYKVTVINQVYAMRISHRISGRPFDSPRGRRRARARR
jgi:hypothetical protein